MVIDPGEYTYLNAGGIAVLRVCLENLHEVWPGAEITVLTGDEQSFVRVFRGARALDVAGHRLFFAEGALLGRMRSRMPDRFGRYIGHAQSALRSSKPNLWYRILCLRHKRNRLAKANLTAFFEAVARADVVVCSGMAGLRAAEIHALETLRLAVSLKKVTAMFSLGLYPLDRLETFRSARSVLPKVGLIALREERSGSAIAKAIGAPGERVVVSGDDAIQLAYRVRRGSLGDAIGVNLRLKPSMEIGDRPVECLRGALNAVSSRLNARFIGIPTARYESGCDVEAIARVLPRGAEKAPIFFDPADLEGICSVIAECRIVITGAYHGAVFAMSQGVPCICLAKSKYFLDKFEGLARCFGGHCLILNVDEVSSQELEAAILTVWEEADKWREVLLRRAEEQCRAIWSAYRRLPGLLLGKSLI